jgi:hypothetical protein
MSDKVYTIKINERTTFRVREHQLFNKKWVNHFGSVENVKLFIKGYKK